MAVLGLTDGQDVTLVAGGQGGFHVWLSYAVSGASGMHGLEREAHRVSDGAVVSRYPDGVDIGAPDDSGWWHAPSQIPMFMCPRPVGSPVVHQPIRLGVRL